MTNPFATEDMAAGYATSRPPIHARILERVRPRLAARFPRALDIGCGAGLSTRALHCLADQCIGIEPVEAMLQWGTIIAPQSEFLVAVAEAIPLSTDSIDLMTAAGSLNYVRLDLFFREAARVLRARGMLVVYDFSPGKTFSQGTGLEEWFTRFEERYPPPPNEGRILDPVILGQLENGFYIRSQERFKIRLVLSPAFYLKYMLTETNVAFAIRNGVPLVEIRSWCEDTLGPLWAEKEQEVVFDGYFALMASATAPDLDN